MGKLSLKSGVDLETGEVVKDANMQKFIDDYFVKSEQIRMCKASLKVLKAQLEVIYDEFYEYRAKNVGQGKLFE